MDANCHFAFGMGTGTALALNLDKLSALLPNITNTPETATLFVIGGILGGLFPDIDSPQSYMGRMTAPVSKVIGKISRKFGKAKSYHRGIFHDPAIYIAGLVLSYLYFPPLAGIMIGCLSHVFLDLFNPAGIPFMFAVKRLRLGLVQVDTKESRALTWICTTFALTAGIMVKFDLLR